MEYSFIDTDSRNTAILPGSSKHDVLLRKDTWEGEQPIKCIGVIQGMHSGSDAEGDFEARGKICNFLQIALRVQHWRLTIFGFLTGCRRFDFYKATREEEGISFERCGVIVGESGWEALQTLLSLDNYGMGYKDFEVEGWKVNFALGSGATSVVFYVSPGTNLLQALCKVYEGENRGMERRNREVQALNKLASLPNVPKLLPDAPNQTKDGGNRRN